MKGFKFRAKKAAREVRANCSKKIRRGERWFEGRESTKVDPFHRIFSFIFNENTKNQLGNRASTRDIRFQDGRGRFHGEIPRVCKVRQKTESTVGRP